MSEINTDPIYTSFHITLYAKGVDPKTAYKNNIHYLSHALAVPTESGRVFLYGLDKKLSVDQFEEIKQELKRMAFNEVGRHDADGEVRWQIL